MSRVPLAVAATGMLGPSILSQALKNPLVGAITSACLMVAAGIIGFTLAVVHARRHAELGTHQHAVVPLEVSVLSTVMIIAAAPIIALRDETVLVAAVSAGLFLGAFLLISDMQRLMNASSGDDAASEPWSDAKAICDWRGLRHALARFDAFPSMDLRRWLLDRSGKRDHATGLARLVPWLVLIATVIPLISAPSVTAWIAANLGDGSNADSKPKANGTTTSAAPPSTTTSAAVPPLPSSGQPAGAATAPAAPAPPACLRGEKIGTPAPGPVADELRSVIEGSKTIPRNGVGTGVAGCIQAARRVDGTSTYYMVGVCGTETRSLAVASEYERGRILLQERAKVANGEAKAGRLRSASANLLIGSGDMQLIHTSLGSRLMVRDRTSRGRISTGRPRRGGACAGPTDYNMPYTTLSVDETAAFTDVVVQRGEWAWPRRDGNGDLALFSTPQAGRPHTTIRCASRAPCVSERGTHRREHSGGRPIELCGLARFAPPAAAGGHRDPTDPSPCG